MKIRRFIDDIVTKGNKEDMEKLSCVFEEAMCYLKEYDYDYYKKIKCDLYKLAYGEYITPELAEKWVGDMQPRYKWEKADTDNVMKTKGIKEVSDVDFYVAMNMMYSDYGRILGDEDLDKYVEMSLRFLLDEDVAGNKLFNYYFGVVK